MIPLNPVSLAVHSLVALGLIIGSYTDFKWREMPDWVNFGMIFAGIGINLIASLIYHNQWFIINSIIGLLVFYGIAALMFYTGQWGGGDAKALMGMGALLGLDSKTLLQGQWPFMASFFVNALLIGAVYGLVWSIVLAIKYRKQFTARWKWYWQQWKSQRYLLYGGSFLLIFGSFFIQNLFSRFVFVTLALLGIIMYFAFLFIRSIEESCMYHKRTPQELTEGDWITETITVKQHTIPYQFLKEKYAPVLQREQSHDILYHILQLLEEVLPFQFIHQWKQKRAQHFSFEHWYDQYCNTIAKKADIASEEVKTLLKSDYHHWKQWKKKHQEHRLPKVLEEEALFFDRAVIASPKDLGLELSQISILKRLWNEGKITTVEVKEGIPFIPSFLIAYALTLLWGNLFLLLL